MTTFMLPISRCLLAAMTALTLAAMPAAAELSGAGTAQSPTADSSTAEASAVDNPVSANGLETIAVLDTNHGRMAFRFFRGDAPKTSEQIERLIHSGFYDGKRFYRVVAGHVIQAGDGEGEVEQTVVGEFGRPHIKGTVGLARGTDPNSGTSEIYICLAPRPHLDGKYAAFGEIIEGMEVLEKIGALPVDKQFVGDGVAFHKPKQPVIIERGFLEQRSASEQDAKPSP